jgi:hypothetical protein
MIRIIIEYDKDDESGIANIFGRFLFSCVQIDGTGWTEFQEYLKEIYIRKNADYSPVKIICSPK